MYTVSAPKSPWLRDSKVQTLREAIRRKHAWQVNQPGTHAIITDADGYIVSTKEQSVCISGIDAF